MINVDLKGFALIYLSGELIKVSFILEDNISDEDIKLTNEEIRESLRNIFKDILENKE